MPGKIHIGTSGWNYKHWKGTFYPEDLSQKEWLDFYKDRLDTVEINNSFYRLPEKKTFIKWKNSVSGNFIFSAKASRYITHMKKLKGPPEESLKNMLDNFEGLGDHLKPILFQLPPNWKFNEERLKSFIDILPDNFLYTFELRDERWINDTSTDILKDRNIAFCIYELAGYQSPLNITADFVYIRLHGPGKEKYQGKYTKKQLSGWADHLKDWQANNLDVYLYFDNDEQGFAAQNAMELKEMVG
ncbi:MAG: DUF72 domain-containing protein [Balneolaceae bacterium]